MNELRIVIPLPNYHFSIQDELTTALFLLNHIIVLQETKSHRMGGANRPYLQPQAYNTFNENCAVR